jgi:hypothetical protein
MEPAVRVNLILVIILFPWFGHGIVKEVGMAGCQFQLGSGGDFVAQFGRDLVYGFSLGEVKKKIEARWNKSIGRAYTISFVDGDGNFVTDVYVPKLVKARLATRREGSVAGQLEFGFDL